MQARAAAIAPTVFTPDLARVAVETDVTAALPDWRALLARAPCSPYQSDGWVLPWLATLAGDVTPALAFGYGQNGTALAMLPLGITRQFGLSIASFLGGRDSNTGLGLFDPAATFDAAITRRFLADVADRARVDLFVLRNQPAAWNGHVNPLAALPHTISPSRLHEADLGRSPESFFAATLSRHARKSIRQKEAKLAAHGVVRHEVAGTAERAAAIARWLLAQRGDRFGRDVAHDGLMQRMLVDAYGGAVQLHALVCGDTIVAALAAATHAGRMSGMLLAFDPAWARFSPGELIVARVVADACRRGFASFDLGIGEARYKDTFCPRAEPLFDTLVGVTWRGRMAAAVLRGHIRLKRRVKASRPAWALITGQRALRRRLRGLAARLPGFVGRDG